MFAASVWLILSRWDDFLHALPKPSYRLICTFIGILLVGTLAFMANLIFGWSSFDEAKNPFTQFTSQCLLLLIVPLITVAHANLFSNPRCCSFLMKALVWAASIHLMFGVLNALQVLNFAVLPLSLFRNTEVSVRVAGLMSEPSYLGTMAALYGLPLLSVHPVGTKTRLWRYGLGLALFVLALYANAKTVVPTSVCGLIGYAWYKGARIFTLKRIVVITCIAGLAFTIIVVNSAFDLQENLSSAMRFGSTLTALTAAVKGFGLIGVGFGQFHFFYSERFMPRFLLLSAEAVSQMSSTAEQRASTFNLFVRYWIETGLIGILLLLGLLRYLYRLAKIDRGVGSLIGVLLLSCSIGFLLTQDPYCYPPMLLGAALILGAHDDASEAPTAVAINPT
jgi:hypothetical protein